MGVALSPCTVPAAGEPGFALGPDEIELGLGIHGEPGVRRARIASADALATEMVSRILTDRGIGRGERVALLVNNLGGTPTMELAIVARRAIGFLNAEGVTVERAWCGTFLSALEMAGCSISLMRLDDRRVQRLDAPASAPAWVPGTGPARLDARRVSKAPSAGESAEAQEAAGDRDTPLARALTAVAEALKQAEPRLTTMDREVGDGDLGISLAYGAAAILRELPMLDPLPAAALRQLARAIRQAVGGTSGPLYAMLLLRAGAALPPHETTPSAASWMQAFAAGVDGVSTLGGARAGDRTMLDAMLPAVAALRQAIEDGRPLSKTLAAAVAAAEHGAAQTASMLPRKGRSSYLGERVLGKVDPGAEAVVIWLRAVRQALMQAGD